LRRTPKSATRKRRRGWERFRALLGRHCRHHARGMRSACNSTWCPAAWTLRQVGPGSPGIRYRLLRPGGTAEVGAGPRTESLSICRQLFWCGAMRSTVVGQAYYFVTNSCSGPGGPSVTCQPVGRVPIGVLVQTHAVSQRTAPSAMSRHCHGGETRPPSLGWLQRTRTTGRRPRRSDDLDSRLSPA